MTFVRGRVSARLESSLGRHPGSAVGLESRGRRAALSDTHRPRRFLRPWGALADARRSALLADAVSPPKIDAKATCNPWNDSRSSGLTSATAARSATRPSRSNSRPEADRPTAVVAAATFSPAPLPWAMPNSDVYGVNLFAGGGSGSAPARCARLRCAAAPTGKGQSLAGASLSNKNCFLV